MSVVDDARKHSYRIRCAKLAGVLNGLENAKSRAFRGPNMACLRWRTNRRIRTTRSNG